MALDTLKGVKKLGEFNVVDMDEIRVTHPEMFRPDGSMHYHLFEKNIRPTNFIYVRHDVNSISFTIQKGPIKENGINGCQVDALIHAAATIIQGLNDKFPSGYNECAIWSLEAALGALRARTKDRERRGVEGHNNI